ncbi:MAG: hypothetical protein Q7J07_09930, partial [Pelolinea sp.]|nr:hypothetical protein [Pelolinea sp.]
MLDFYKKILQVLSLERDKGFQNTAVAGGLGKFLGFIEQQGENNKIQDDLIASLIKYFKAYNSLTYAERKESINQIIDWLSDQPIEINEQSFQKLFNFKKNIFINTTTNTNTQDAAIYADIRSIKGIGDKNYKYFEKLGIENIYNLMRYFPRRYQDYSQLKTINSIDYGEELTVAGVIKGNVHTRKSKRGNLNISEALLSDSTGSLRLIWF